MSLLVLLHISCEPVVCNVIWTGQAGGQSPRCTLGSKRLAATFQPSEKGLQKVAGCLLTVLQIACQAVNMHSVVQEYFIIPLVRSDVQAMLKKAGKASALGSLEENDPDAADDQDEEGDDDEENGAGKRSIVVDKLTDLLEKTGLGSWSYQQST